MATPASVVPLAMFFFVKQGLLVVGGRNSFTKRDLPTAEFYLPSNKNWTKMGTPGYRCFCAVTFRLSVSMGNHVSTNNLTVATVVSFAVLPVSKLFLPPRFFLGSHNVLHFVYVHQYSWGWCDFEWLFFLNK